ncbi:ABC transporter permease [Vulcanisaeta thermophila]|uniref:ABC transporter permease n=1 Tax=Vulcanisaeta thermophila TaxID=867917 RepID=UPI000852FBE1|nr:ABC transporter permease [Vulcanisaeta thermophila]
MKDVIVWILKRLGIAAGTVFLVISATYILLRYAPGNPLQLYIGSCLSQGYSLETCYARAKLVFLIDPNEPPLEAYANYLVQLAHGDLGRSLIYHLPVAELIAKEIPWTVFLVTTSLLLSYALGVLIGLFSAKYSGGKIDSAVTTISAAVNAIPNYILAIILLLFLAVYSHIFPINGSYSVPASEVGFNWIFISNVLYHYTLPILSFAIPMIPGWILGIRSAAVAISKEDYVMYARLRGVKSRDLMINYIGRLAVIPSFTRLMYSFGLLLGAAAFIESTFGLFGIGSLYATALSSRDYPLAISTLMIIVAVTVLGNIIADILYGVLDPRVRVR